MKLSEPNILKVRLHKLFLDRKVDPFKVMVTGDWHISPIVSEKQLDYIKEAIVQSDPDVIILQGDLVDSPIELRRETSLRKLIKELRLCSGVAPTVLVLGSHDYITPTKPVKIMKSVSIHIWKKICKRCGVKLLLNEWYDATPSLRIFGAFQDERCCVKENRKSELAHWDRPAGFAENLREVKDLIMDGVDNSNRVFWFAAHAPLLNNEVTKRLESFDVASFGHTHGGIVPLGIDELFDKLHLHFGLISPNMLPLPRRSRGMMPISNSTMMVVNPGMIATHFSKPKLLQNMNFIKAAEVSVVEVESTAMNKETESEEKRLGEIELDDEEKELNRNPMKRFFRFRMLKKKSRPVTQVGDNLGEFF